MPTFNVLVPFAGHIAVTVEAESEDEAITAALAAATLEDVESWEARPWEAEAEMEDQD